MTSDTNSPALPPAGEKGEASLRDAAPTTSLTADFARALPGGKLDDTAYEQIEGALDRADAPMRDGGRWLTLAERVAALAATRNNAPVVQSTSGALPAPSPELVEKVAKAIEGAGNGYHIELSRLVDGISTYTLTYQGEAAVEFEGYEEASEHVTIRREEDRARAAIQVVQEAQWQDISTAPRDGTTIILATPTGVRCGSWGCTTYDRKSKSYNRGWTIYVQAEVFPTLWMPLPAPPALPNGGL